MENFQPSMEKTVNANNQRAEESPAEKKAALEKLFNVHMQNVQKARDNGDSDSAETSFNLMIAHIRKHNLTDEEMFTTIKDLAREQAIFQQKICSRLKGRPGLTMETERLNRYLEIGNLTLDDLKTETLDEQN